MDDSIEIRNARYEEIAAVLNMVGTIVGETYGDPETARFEQHGVEELEPSNEYQHVDGPVIESTEHRVELIRQQNAGDPLMTNTATNGPLQNSNCSV